MRNIFLICFFSIGLLFNFSSCSDQIYSTDGNTKNSLYDKYPSKWLYIECLQGLSNTSDYSYCLAKNSSYEVFFIINLTCPERDKNQNDIYYDKKNLSGSYVFVGTYTYESKGSGTKTVPAYMPTNNFQELYFHHRKFMKDILDLVLSYNIIKD